MRYVWWHTISMTTQGVDAKPGDELNVQLAATDWGLREYHVDVDYYRAEVVLAEEAARDLSGLDNALADGVGVLKLTTQSVQQGGNYTKAYGEDLGEEFDKIRVFEVFGGPAQWEQENITFDAFAQGQPLEKLVNEQMIVESRRPRHKAGKPTSPYRAPRLYFNLQ